MRIAPVLIITFQILNQLVNPFCHALQSARKKLIVPRLVVESTWNKKRESFLKHQNVYAGETNYFVSDRGDEYDEVKSIGDGAEVFNNILWAQMQLAMKLTGCSKVAVFFISEPDRESMSIENGENRFSSATKLQLIAEIENNDK